MEQTVTGSAQSPVDGALKSRLPVILIALDAFADQVLDVVGQTTTESDAVASQFTTAIRSSEVNESRVRAVVRSAAASADSSTAQIVVWIIANLARDKTENKDTRSDARDIAKLAEQAAAAVNTSAHIRCIWQIGDLAPNTSACPPEALRALQQELGGVVHFVVSGTGPMGPACESFDELVHGTGVALASMVLPSDWGTLAHSPFLAEGPFSVFDARLAEHPADLLTDWVADRLIVSVASALGTLEPQAAVVPLEWDTIALGGATKASIPVKTPEPGWFESRQSLHHKVASARGEFLDRINDWRSATSAQVADAPSECAKLARASVSSNIDALHGSVEDVLAHRPNGVGAAYGMASLTEAAQLSVLRQADAGMTPFPQADELDLSRVEHEYERIHGFIDTQPENIALALYGLSTLLLLVVAAWVPLTTAFPGLRGATYAIGGPLVLVSLLAFLYGIVRRQALRREVGPGSRLAHAQQDAAVIWEGAVEGTKSAMSDRWRTRAIRQGYATLAKERQQLYRALLLVRKLVEDRSSVPTTPAAFAATLSLKYPRFHRRMLGDEAVVGLAAIELAKHSERLKDVTQESIDPAVTAWYQDDNDRCVRQIEGWIHEQCRDIALSGLQPDPARLDKELVELLDRAHGLAVFRRTGLTKDRLQEFTVAVMPGNLVDVPSEQVKQLFTHRLPLDSMNKLFVLKLWAGLQIENLNVAPTARTVLP